MDTTTQKLADALRAIAAQGYLDTGLSDAEYVTYWSALALKHRKIAKEALAALKTSDSQKNTEALKGQQPRHEDVSEALHDLRKHMKAHLKVEPTSEMTAYWVDCIDKILDATPPAAPRHEGAEDARDALRDAKAKLEAYHQQTGGKHAGGREIHGLIRDIDSALAYADLAPSNAERYLKLRELSAPFGEWKVSHMTSINGGRPERQWLHEDALDEALDAALKQQPRQESTPRIMKGPHGPPHKECPDCRGVCTPVASERSGT